MVLAFEKKSVQDGFDQVELLHFSDMLIRVKKFIHIFCVILKLWQIFTERIFPPILNSLDNFYIYRH